jgi:hypothetical protein
MVLFLTIIDIAYFAQHKMFAGERGGKENLSLVIPNDHHEPATDIAFYLIQV